jgi:ABC-type transporter Mla subunit MlaD
VAVFALVENVKTMRVARTFFEETSANLQPLIEKADVTIDAVNAELLRVDGIVTTLEDVSDRVSDTTSVVHTAVNAPAEVANVMGVRLREAWRAARRARKTP